MIPYDATHRHEPHARHVTRTSPIARAGAYIDAEARLIYQNAGTPGQSPEARSQTPAVPYETLARKLESIAGNPEGRDIAATVQAVLADWHLKSDEAQRLAKDIDTALTLHTFPALDPHLSQPLEILRLLRDAKHYLTEEQYQEVLVWMQVKQQAPAAVKPADPYALPPGAGVYPYGYGAQPLQGIPTPSVSVIPGSVPVPAPVVVQPPRPQQPPAVGLVRGPRRPSLQEQREHQLVRQAQVTEQHLYAQIRDSWAKLQAWEADARTQLRLPRAVRRTLLPTQTPLYQAETQRFAALVAQWQQHAAQWQGQLVPSGFIGPVGPESSRLPASPGGREVVVPLPTASPLPRAYPVTGIPGPFVPQTAPAMPSMRPLPASPSVAPQEAPLPLEKDGNYKALQDLWIDYSGRYPAIADTAFLKETQALHILLLQRWREYAPTPEQGQRWVNFLRARRDKLETMAAAGRQPQNARPQEREKPKEKPAEAPAMPAEAASLAKAINDQAELRRATNAAYSECRTLLQSTNTTMRRKKLDAIQRAQAAIDAELKSRSEIEPLLQKHREKVANHPAVQAFDQRGAQLSVIREALRKEKERLSPPATPSPKPSEKKERTYANVLDDAKKIVTAGRLLDVVFYGHMAEAQEVLDRLTNLLQANETMNPEKLLRDLSVHLPKDRFTTNDGKACVLLWKEDHVVLQVQESPSAPPATPKIEPKANPDEKNDPSPDTSAELQKKQGEFLRILGESAPFMRKTGIAYMKALTKKPKDLQACLVAIEGERTHRVTIEPRLRELYAFPGVQSSGLVKVSMIAFEDRGQMLVKWEMNIRKLLAKPSAPPDLQQNVEQRERRADELLAQFDVDLLAAEGSGKLSAEQIEMYQSEREDARSTIIEKLKSGEEGLAKGRALQLLLKLKGELGMKE